MRSHAALGGHRGTGRYWPARITGAAWPSPLKWLGHEAEMSWRVVVRDLPATTIPGVLFTLSAWRTVRPETPLPRVLAESIGYFWLYVYAFCLANQSSGAEEDRINKPHRPLPRGMVTVRWMHSRLLAAAVALAVVGVALHVAWWMLLWVALIVVYTYLGWHRHWLTRNLFIALGTLAQLGAAWQLVGPITATGWQWIAVLSLQAGIVITLQDLRDVAGDAATGRRTAPIVFGEQRVRIVLALCFLLLPVAGHLLLSFPGGPARVLVDLLQVLLSVSVAARLAVQRSSRADHLTISSTARGTASCAPDWPWSHDRAAATPDLPHVRREPPRASQRHGRGCHGLSGGSRPGARRATPGPGPCHPSRAQAAGLPAVAAPAG